MNSVLHNFVDSIKIDDKMSFKESEPVDFEDFLTAISTKYSVVFQKSTLNFKSYNIESKKVRIINNIHIKFQCFCFAKENILIGFSSQKFYIIDLDLLSEKGQYIISDISTEFKSISFIGLDQKSSELEVFFLSNEDNSVYRQKLDIFSTPELILSDVDHLAVSKNGIFVSQLDGVRLLDVSGSNITEVFYIPIVTATHVTAGLLNYTVRTSNEIFVFNEVGSCIDKIPYCDAIFNQLNSSLFIKDKYIYFVEPYIGEVILKTVAAGLLEKQIYYWDFNLKCHQITLPKPKIETNIIITKESNNIPRKESAKNEYRGQENRRKEIEKRKKQSEEENKKKKDAKFNKKEDREEKHGTNKQKDFNRRNQREEKINEKDFNRRNQREEKINEKEFNRKNQREEKINEKDFNRRNQREEKINEKEKREEKTQRNMPKKEEKGSERSVQMIFYFDDGQAIETGEFNSIIPKGDSVIFYYPFMKLKIGFALVKTHVKDEELFKYITGTIGQMKIDIFEAKSAKDTFYLLESPKIRIRISDFKALFQLLGVKPDIVGNILAICKPKKDICYAKEFIKHILINGGRFFVYDSISEVPIVMIDEIDTNNKKAVDNVKKLLSSLKEDYLFIPQGNYVQFLNKDAVKKALELDYSKINGKEISVVQITDPPMKKNTSLNVNIGGFPKSENVKSIFDKLKKDFAGLVHVWRKDDKIVCMFFTDEQSAKAAKKRLSKPMQFGKSKIYLQNK